MADLRQAFELFDLDRNGLLDAVELRSVLHMLGIHLDEDEVLRMIATVDTRGDRQVTFEGFVKLVEPRPEGLDQRADLKEAFAAIDTDGDGRVSRSELRQALQRHDTDEATQEVERIFQLVDADTLDFESFASIIGDG